MRAFFGGLSSAGTAGLDPSIIRDRRARPVLPPGLDTRPVNRGAQFAFPSPSDVQMTTSRRNTVAPRGGGLTALLSLLVAATPPVAAQDLLTPADLASLDVRPEDRQIAYGDDPLQFGRLYLPAGGGPHPVVAFIHGGCFLSAFDIEHASPLSATLAEEGYAVWSVEYRRVGNDGGGWPSTFLDVGEALDHLRDLADEHTLDLERLVVAGHSAGGTLALWAAGRNRIPESSPLHVSDPLEPRAVFGLAAVGDLEAAQMLGVCGSVVDRLMGGAPVDVPDRYEAASPMRLLPLAVPVTSVVGALDSWTPPALSWVYRARAVGSAGIEVVELPESGHFEMIAPSSSSWPLVVNALRATFDAIDP